MNKRIPAAFSCGQPYGGLAPDLLMRIAQSTPTQQEAIRQLLDGHPTPTQSGPLLTNMSGGARRLGVSRGTLWRMCRAGILERVEIAPGVFRLRCSDLEALANKKNSNPPMPRNPAHRRGRKNGGV